MDTLDFTSRSVPSRHLPVGDYDMDTEEFVEDKRSFDDFQAPAGTRIPETVGREIQMDFTDQGDAGDRVGTAPIDGPEDAVGPNNPNHTDYISIDEFQDEGVEAAANAAAAAHLIGHNSSSAIIADLEAAETAYETQHPEMMLAGSSPPKQHASIATSEMRTRVLDRLRIVLSNNASFDSKGVVDGAAVAIEQSLYDASRSRSVYQAITANALRVGNDTGDIDEIIRISLGKPKPDGGDITASEDAIFVLKKPTERLNLCMMQGFLGQMDVRHRPSCTQLASISGQRVSVAPQQPQHVPVVRSVECTATTNVKLPATHIKASQAALQQLKSTKTLNRYAMEKKSSIIAIGLTIHNAPVELREKLAVPEAEWPRAIQELCSYPHIEEAAVLSTCNRLEIYLVGLSFHRGVREVEEWMHRASGVPLEELRPYLFLLRDRDATSHLLRVSGGLDSLVMGEGQILAQVKQVHKVGQNCPGFGRQLNGLFKQAVTAGKRVRSETSISSGAVSVSSAAAELALLKLPSHNFADARICIIGAGKMSKLLVKHLSSKGCTKVTVLNRSLPRAEALAEEFPEVEFDIRLMPELMDCVANSDVIFAASGSEELLIHASDLEGMPANPEIVGSVRRFIDISVPRNIAPDINNTTTGIVYNVDDLKEVVAANKEERAKAAAEAEILLKEEQVAFEAWRDSLETVPTIKALRTMAENVRSGELERALGKLGEGLTNKQKKAVEELSKGIVNKLLHGPMTALRCDGADPLAVSQTLANMEALERMFDLAESLEADRLATATNAKKQ